MKLQEVFCFVSMKTYESFNIYKDHLRQLMVQMIQDVATNISRLNIVFKNTETAKLLLQLKLMTLKCSKKITKISTRKTVKL